MCVAGIASVGQWGDIIEFPLIPVAAAALPNGEVRTVLPITFCSLFLYNLSAQAYRFVCAQIKKV